MTQILVPDMCVGKSSKGIGNAIVPQVAALLCQSRNGGALMPYQPNREDVDLMIAYVVDHAADHEDTCPCDDTCECWYAGRNAAVNRICKFLESLVKVQGHA